MSLNFYRRDSSASNLRHFQYLVSILGILAIISFDSRLHSLFRFEEVPANAVRAESMLERPLPISAPHTYYLMQWSSQQGEHFIQVVSDIVKCRKSIFILLCHIICHILFHAFGCGKKAFIPDATLTVRIFFPLRLTMRLSHQAETCSSLCQNHRTDP